MGGNKVATSLLAILLLAGAAESQDLWNDANRYLADYIATVQTTIDDFSPQFDQVEQVVAYVASEAIRNAEGDLSSLSNAFIREVERLRSEANDQNRDSIEQCIAPYYSEMTNLPDITRPLIHDCVNNMEQDTATEVLSARGRAQSYLGVADVLRADIDSCAVVEDEDECLSRIIIEILLQTLEAPTSIQELFRRAEDILISYIHAIPGCTIDRINNIASLTHTVLTTINNCVEAI